MKISLLASGEPNNLFIISAVLLLVAFLAAICSWYLTISYKRNSSEIKFASVLMVSVLILTQIISLISSILSIIFALNVIKNIDLSNILTIVSIIIAFITLGISFVMIIFFSNRIWFYMDDEKISTLGEAIKLSKIQKIIEDDEKSAVYVNYLEGKRTLKKIKFSKKTAIGIYFLEVASKTGIKPEKGNQISYFKEEISKLRAQALELSKKEIKKSENKNETDKKEEK
ncbi:hypothetical protein [Spiroplasma diminutum]|uniref:Transmembrane protein n=1 Tax=Spiroplasma diminutum CUAS-1 TaxID=1276221 RepID=S5MDY0_9MOLU|nr:hypothetical protein [Spiroplasma diminutum]AGR41928.1 hypothetical protein SDIMI_v3c02240 [Spiroplasma diminutum CUAS-1]